MDTDLEIRRKRERIYEEISPFEFKNELIRLAREREKKSARAMLDAGRGNPNWIAATPRDAFFTLGHFAVTESRRIWNAGHLGGKPGLKDIYKRFKSYCEANRDAPGIDLLGNVVEYGVRRMGFDADAWVYELVDGIIGDNYPEPDRMLVHTEKIVHDYILREMCQGEEACSDFNLFATEGATAAMCYLFDSLLENYLLKKGDKVAIMVPIFPPYVEIPHLHKYDFDVVEIHATATDEQGNHTWQYPKSEIDKLTDKSVKALFLVNPSNPPSVALDAESVYYIVDTVKTHNPDLMIISDDVYCTFVEGFRSLMADLPFNTAGVYSFSKYFGVTGWRLGVISIQKDNVFDKLIQSLPEEKAKTLDLRYASMTQHPREIKFIDRVVADSRQVALNHTAGLSTPQQIQMAIFCAFQLLDEENQYKKQTMDICHRRMKLLYDGLGLPCPNLPHDADYYTAFDLALWADRHYGKDFTKYLQDNYEPVDVLFRLAETSSIVLLNGGGFYGPRWSIRISLANLDDDAYAEIGKDLHEALSGYVKEWEQQKGK